MWEIGLDCLQMLQDILQIENRRHAGDDRTSYPLPSLLDTVFFLENCEDPMKITLNNRTMRL